MSGILERMLQSQQFTPTTVEEYIALRLAHRLSDESAAKRYVQYMGHHTTEHLIRLFHKAKRELDPARAFHQSVTTDEP